MDAAKTQSQSLALRKKWIERQHLTNYRSEHDRLLGEFSHLKPDLQRAAAQNIMDRDKLKAIGEYKEPEPEKKDPDVVFPPKPKTTVVISKFGNKYRKKVK